MPRFTVKCLRARTIQEIAVIEFDAPDAAMAERLAHEAEMFGGLDWTGWNDEIGPATYKATGI